MQRRSFIAAASATALLPSLALAQKSAWPSAPVQIVVPFGAGGGTTDPLARMIAEELGKQMGANFVVLNKPGANGNIGAAFVKRSSPDGLTLLFTGAGTVAVNPALYKDPGFDTKADFEPVVVVGSVANILVVNPSLPVKNVQEFVEYAKANPGKLTYGTSGNGSSMHMAAELFAQHTGISMVHAPYNNAATPTTDLVGGNIQAMFQLVPGISEFVKNQKVNALAVMSANRSPRLPDVPTMAEAGFPGLESSTWLCMMAPKGTPSEIVNQLNAEVNKLLQQPAFRERIIAMGIEPMGGSVAEFSSFLDTEIQKWGDVVKAAKISVE